jgi:hypothetical protein
VYVYGIVPMSLHVTEAHMVSFFWGWAKMKFNDQNQEHLMDWNNKFWILFKGKYSACGFQVAEMCVKC